MFYSRNFQSFFTIFFISSISIFFLFFYWFIKSLWPYFFITGYLEGVNIFSFNMCKKIKKLNEQSWMTTYLRSCWLHYTYEISVNWILSYQRHVWTTACHCLQSVTRGCVIHMPILPLQASHFIPLIESKSNSYMKWDKRICMLIVLIWNLSKWKENCQPW